MTGPLETYAWTGGFFSGSGSYNVGSNDNDDMVGVFTQPKHLARVTIKDTGGYFHYHSSGQRGQVSLREAGTTNWIILADYNLALGDVRFDSINIQVPFEHQRRLFDALRFQSVPAVNQGMHGVSSFNVTFEIAQSAYGGDAAPYGTRSFGGGARVQTYTSVPFGMSVNAGAGVSMDMDVEPTQGDFVLYESPADADIILATDEGPGTFHSDSTAKATVTFDEPDVSFSVSAQSNGAAGGEWTLGRRHPVEAVAAGEAAIDADDLLLLRGRYGDVYALDSSPNPGDITLEGRTGPNTQQSTSVGVSTVTMGQGTMHPVSMRSNGVATLPGWMISRLRQLANNFNGRSTVVAPMMVFASDSSVFGHNLYLTRSLPSEDSVVLYRSDVVPGRPQLSAGSFYIYTHNPPRNSSDVKLATKYGPAADAAMSSVATGRASVTMDMTRSVPLSSTSHGKAGGDWYLGTPIQQEAVASGVAGARTINNIIGSWYLGSPAQVASTSNGVAGARDGLGNVGSWYLSGPIPIAMTSRGVGAVPKNELGGRIEFAMTSRGVAAARSLSVFDGWYLGTPARIESLSAGIAGGTWYLAGPVELPLTTAAGRAGVSSFDGAYLGSWYMSSPIVMPSLTSVGRAAFTNNYLAGPVPITTTINGRAGSTSNYLSAPLRVSMKSAGVATVASYVASPVRIWMKTDWFSGGGGVWYLAGPVVMKATIAGRGSFIFDTSIPGAMPYTNPRGVGRLTISLDVIENVTKQFAMRANSGCNVFEGYLADYRYEHADISYWLTQRHSSSYHTHGSGWTGVEGVRFYQTGATYQRATSRGVARMMENEEFIPWNFKTRVHAGCNAYTHSLYHPGQSQYTLDRWLDDGVTEDAYTEMVLAENRPGAGHDNLRYGVSMYVSSTMQFATQTMRGVGKLEFEREYEMVINAGCNSGISYRSDDDPAYFSGGGGTATAGGVWIFPTGPTYMTAHGDTWARSKPTLVHATMSVTWQRIWTAPMNGVAKMRLGDPDKIYFNGVASFWNNYVNNESYSAQRWHTWTDGDGSQFWPESDDERRKRAGGVGFMSLYAAGRVEMDAWRSNGVGGGWNYLAGPVYLETTSRGVSHNWLDSEAYYHYATVYAGCYPYYYVTEPTDTDPGGDVIWKPGVEFSQDRVHPAFNTVINGRSWMTIEIEGVPLIRWTSHGIGRMISGQGFDVVKETHRAVSHGGSYGWKSYSERWGTSVSTGLIAMFGYREYGVVMTQFQRRDWQSDGVGKMYPSPTFAFYLVWHKWDDGGALWPENNESGLNRRAGGRAMMFIEDDRKFMSVRSETNLHYWKITSHLTHSGYYETRSAPLYAPDEWEMVGDDFALAMRIRGRGKLWAGKLFGDLLSRLFIGPQPGVPTIDGHERPAHGQYWPRHNVMPKPLIPSSANKQWHEYEYYRR